jgi:hypothetical protein
MSMPTSSSPTRPYKMMQSYILIGLGVLLLLGALLLKLNPFAVPVGLFLFGLGLLVAAFINPTRLVIAGVLYTFVGAAIFIAYKPLIPYDNGLVVLAIGLALLAIALASRRGYIRVGALTPAIFVIVIGLFLYPPVGRVATMLFAPFILSLWFPGIAFLLLGTLYWLIDRRKAEVEDNHQSTKQ